MIRNVHLLLCLLGGIVAWPLMLAAGIYFGAVLPVLLLLEALA